MRSQRSFLRGIALLAVTSVLLASCTTKAPEQAGNALDQPFETTGIDTERIGEPVPVKAGDSKAAATLAEQVMKGGPEGIAALATAVNLAGITITDINGEVFRKPTNPSIGQTLQAGEIGLLADLQSRGESHLRVGGIMAFAIGALDPETEPDEKAIMSEVLADLRAATTSKFTTEKFIASFIIELEKRSNTPVDLGKKVADPTAVQFSPVSTTLLVLRTVGEIRAAFPKDTVVETPSAGGQGGGTGQPVIRPVGYSAGAAGNRTVKAAATPPKCSTGKEEVDDFLYDRAGQVRDYIKKKKEAAKNASQAAAKSALGKYGKDVLGVVVGALLEFLKLVVAGAFFKPKMEMRPNKLERTRSASQDGDKAVVYATIRFDTGGWQWANCARPILVLFGLDFAVKADAPVKNAPVTWLPGNGFKPTSDGLPLVKLDLVTPVGIGAEKTNEKGETAVTVIGHRQAKQVPETAKKVEKSFTLNGTYHSQADNFWGDLVFGLGLFATALTGPAGWAAAAIKLYVKALEEGGLYKFGRTFPLIDYGGDYKINYTVGGITFTGLVCQSPVGQWDIKMTGKIGDSGTNWTYTGGITVKLNKDGTGPASGVLKGKSSGIFGFGRLEQSASFGGKAKLHDAGSTMWLEIKVEGDNAAEISGPKGLIASGRGEPGTFTIPVDVGNFCGAS